MSLLTQSMSKRQAAAGMDERKQTPRLQESNGASDPIVVDVAAAKKKKKDKSDLGVSDEAGVVVGAAATQGKKVGVAATKGTPNPSSVWEGGTGVVGDALLAFKVLSQQLGSDTGFVEEKFHVTTR